ncbi:MAG: LCP family protein [Anaerovoracaceae bacterium]|jgi:LCP family protein required for cell wall assembly
MRSKKYQKIYKNPQVQPAGGAGPSQDSRKKTALIVVLVILLAIIAAAGGAWIYVNGLLDNVNRDTSQMTKKELSCVDVDGYVNIALLGVDSRSMSKKNLKDNNTDCIIVVSLNEKSKDVNLISIYRDTYTKIGDTTTYQKINSAYTYGGAKMAMQTINQTLDIDVEKYVLFNFKMVSDLVNSVGGITVNVKEAEIEELNKYTAQTAHNIGQKKYKLVKKPGKQTLEGVQAVSYGRIRKGVGDDFQRTSRMRLVIKKVLAKLKKSDYSTIIKTMKLCLKQCRTNLSNNDLIGLAQRLSGFQIKKSVGFPYTVTTGDLNGVSYVFPADLSANIVKLHKQMFGQEDYQVSDTAQAISDQIMAIAGSQGSDSSQLGKNFEGQ